jgi:hypothetical protein
VLATLTNKKAGNTMPIKKLASSWWALSVGLGLAATLAGLDKFFNLLTNWNMYLSPMTERFLPVSGHTFMLITRSHRNCRKAPEGVLKCRHSHY